MLKSPGVSLGDSAKRPVVIGRRPRPRIDQDSGDVRNAIKKALIAEAMRAFKKDLAITYFRTFGTIIGRPVLTIVFGMGTSVSPDEWSPERVRVLARAALTNPNIDLRQMFW